MFDLLESVFAALRTTKSGYGCLVIFLLLMATSAAFIIFAANRL
jgi:hypothetical protein